jgi:hypothetical protein
MLKSLLNSFWNNGIILPSAGSRVSTACAQRIAAKRAFGLSWPICREPNADLLQMIIFEGRLYKLFMPVPPASRLEPIRQGVR